MTKQSLQTNIYWLLLQIAVGAKHNLMKVAERHGLTAMQLFTLCLLESNKSIPMYSLSTKLHCDASNITGIIDRLFSQGYITREENPHDRREKMITLTAKGTELCEKALQEILQYQPAWIQSLSTSKRQQLESLLSKALETPTTNCSS